MPFAVRSLSPRSALIIVGFDTATDDTVVGASVDGETVTESVIPPGPEGRPVHSQGLLGAVTEAAEAAGGWSRIDRIAVGTGPGTFTGIRIGLATANGIALSTGIELAGVSTLATLARPMLGPDHVTLALLDARRGEVFAALYGPAGEVLREPFVCGPDELASRIGEFDPGLVVGGPGAVRFREELDRADIATVGPEAGFNLLSAGAICELGASVDSEQLSNPLEPTYLRVPDAQLWLERDGRKAGP
ncbi:MAG: tRNA (adenosine(37)-N6)-threonylcarbamoyltransferase complex dimerization subunit type 1 TsaB [Thermoleophilia bacterium]|nr:tRNA (adenosine(37)-N6)-threonylcarbamoyltransferase complex dimerization subunit type 1 TsaB [Thermoleophilia bacterium]